MTPSRPTAAKGRAVACRRCEGGRVINWSRINGTDCDGPCPSCRPWDAWRAYDAGPGRKFREITANGAPDDGRKRFTRYWLRSGWTAA